MNTKNFGDAMNAYQKELEAAHIAPPEFATRLSVLRGLPGVLGCKGSGAQGGDCALVLVQNCDQESIQKLMKSEGFQPFLPVFI